MSGAITAWPRSLSDKYQAEGCGEKRRKAAPLSKHVRQAIALRIVTISKRSIAKRLSDEPIGSEIQHFLLDAQALQRVWCPVPYMASMPKVIDTSSGKVFVLVMPKVISLNS